MTERDIKSEAQKLADHFYIHQSLRHKQADLIAAFGSKCFATGRASRDVEVAELTERLALTHRLATALEAAVLQLKTENDDLAHRLQEIAHYFGPLVRNGKPAEGGSYASLAAYDEAVQIYKIAGGYEAEIGHVAGNIDTEVEQIGKRGAPDDVWFGGTD